MSSLPPLTTATATTSTTSTGSNNELCAELVAINLKLLNAIQDKDWTIYEALVDSTVTCFEPEAVGHLVEGLDFHKYYFNLNNNNMANTKNKTKQTTMIRPHVRILDDSGTAAVITYARLTQYLNNDTNEPETDYCEETRVWQKINGIWKNVHFHRSVN